MSVAKLKGWEGAARKMRFTAGANLADGAVVVSQGRVGVVYNPVLSGAVGLAIYATDERGIILPKATGALSANAVVYWDEDGTPVGGSATGAVTATSTANIRIGRVVEAAASGDATCIVEMKQDPLQM